MYTAFLFQSEMKAKIRKKDGRAVRSNAGSIRVRTHTLFIPHNWVVEERHRPPFLWTEQHACSSIAVSAAAIAATGEHLASVASRFATNSLAGWLDR